MHYRRKPWKNKALEPPKRRFWESKPFPNRSQSAPKRRKGQQVAKNALSKRPRRAQERKMSQHSANLRRFSPRIWWVLGSRWPPLKHAKQYVNASINAVGSNTPGAASSAADLEAHKVPKSMPKTYCFGFRVSASILEGLGPRTWSQLGHFGCQT